MVQRCRIKRHSDFRKTFKEGTRINGPHFVLYIRKTESSLSRVGVSIAKSHVRLATRRNRLRRIATEFFRVNVAPHLKGYDVAVASKAACHNKGLKETGNEIKRLLGQIRKAKQ